MALTKVQYTDGVTVIGAKNLNDIQDEIIANGNNITTLSTNKVDKVTGKGLSTLDFTVADRQAISNAYVKPTAGVPKTDLSQDVQTSLDKADNSLQAALDETLTVQGAAADAKATGEAIGDVKSAIDTKAPAIYETASGSIASFTDGADDMPLKSLTVNIEPVQAGSGDPSPDNIRPISGYTEANVTRTGKNLLKYNKLDNNNAETDFIPHTKILKFKNFGSTVASGSLGLRRYDKNFNLVTSVVLTYDIASEYQVTITPQEDVAYIKFRSYRSSTYGGIDAYIDAPFMLAEDVSTYEPYTGNQIPITFPSEAGTVYGGTLDVTSGMLTVDRAGVDMGTIQWEVSDATNGLFYFPRSSIGMSTSSDATGGMITSAYVNRGSISLQYIQNGQVGTNRDALMYIRLSDAHDVASVKSATSGQTLVYELATPIEITLTPTQIKTLLGTNNIWADTGDVDVTYPADTKLFIQNVNKPIDDDMTADTQIASGKYFIIGNTLYLSTTVIPAGDTIIPGTNCQQTNLAEALNALNT